MTTFLTIIHVLLCLFLIGVVLLQSGRSGGMGVLSGAASQQVFGGRGAGNFLQRVTTVVAFMFLLTCTTLGYLASSTRDRGLATPEPGSTTVTVGGARDGGASADAASASPSSETTADSGSASPAAATTESDAAASAEPVATESSDAAAAGEQ
ncbi:MAG: preprotein translocase subunit SecG [Polyangiales bacterium]